MKPIREKMESTAKPVEKSQGKDEMKHKQSKSVDRMETDKHTGFYKGPHNQTLEAGHGERKEHEDHHPAVKMSKGM